MHVANLHHSISDILDASNKHNVFPFIYEEIKYSTARDLRSQLREIAPMNSEGSRIFCPNGPSANVSPLMENKCGDRMALPSVYGRSNDIMGNSIPGFGSNGAATSSAAVAQLRDELNAQAYFR